VLQALHDETRPVSERLALCARAAEADLAGSCGLGVLDPLIREEPAVADRWCDALALGPWRWECHFVAAEAWYHHEDEDRAALQCRQVGDFRRECGQHLYQHPVRAAVGAPGVEGWPESLPQVQALHAAWSARLGPTVPMDPTFWAVFFQISFQRSPAAPLLACDPFPADAAATCRQVWAEERAREAAEATAPPPPPATQEAASEGRLRRPLRPAGRARASAPRRDPPAGRTAGRRR